MRILREISLLLFACASAAAQSKPVISQTPLSQEQISIYRDFLKTYDNGSGQKLNVSRITIPFVQQSWQNNNCLKSLSLPADDAVTEHKFADADLSGLQVNLIEPRKHREADPGDAIKHGESVEDAVRNGFAAGVFTYSEIVFDNSHTHAVFSYSFHCGSLCGNGGVIVYELRDGKWERSKTANCGSWIS